MLPACAIILPLCALSSAIYFLRGGLDLTAALPYLAGGLAGAPGLDALTAALLQHHPYELPEILAVSPSTGLPAYLDWIRAQTREDLT